MLKEISPYHVLRNKFPESEYVLLTEVANTLGSGRCRALDYMIINLWQSRGLSVTGIERKSNRGDWLNEKKNPDKQERHFKFCDYFYLLTDKKDVAKLEEIPDTWGWYHINDSGILKTMKAAPKLNPEPVNRGLLCAMLRRAACKDKFVHVDTLKDEIAMQAEKIQQMKNRQLESDSTNYKALLEKVELFEEHSGITIQYSYGRDIEKIGAAVQVIKNGGVENYIQNLERISEQIGNMHTRTVEKIKTLKQLPQ